MSNVKRERVPNFTTSEKMKLIELVDRNKIIIENKETGSVSARQKEDCWIQILNEFNSSGTGAHRNIDSLKHCWDNLKKKSRKHFADLRCERYKTGMFH